MMAQNDGRRKRESRQPSLNREQLLRPVHPISASSYFTQLPTSTGICPPSPSHAPEGGQDGRSVTDTHHHLHHRHEQQQQQQQQNIHHRSSIVQPSPTRSRQRPHLQQRQVPSSNKMTEPFSAAAAFTNNNNNNDGWGDDWGDWGDNANPVAQQQKGPPPPTQQQQQVVAPLPLQQQPMGTNQYFQQQQQYPPHQQQHAHLDQSNRNFMHNPASGPHQQMYQNYANPQNPVQQHFQPTYPQQQQYPPQQQQQQQYGHPAAPINYFVQRPPSHPPASTTPVQPSPTAAFNQTISDSFDTSVGDSWSWGDNQPTATVPSTVAPVEPQTTQATNAFQEQQNYHHHPHQPAPPSAVSYPPQNASPNHFSLPGAGNNTQQPVAASGKVQVPPQLARLKNETLSPQWSIESQVSQTSSDRSIESGDIGESRSSNTVPSDDGSSGKQQHVENCEIVETYGHYPPQGDVPDKLDEALNSLSIKQEPQPEVPAEERRQERESSFPPPPPSIATSATNSQQADGAAAMPPKSSSKTPPLPPPPTEAGPPPFSMAGPPPAKGTTGNPFKRGLGQRAHIATPGLGVTATPPPVTTPNPSFFYQPQPNLLQTDVTNVENPTPENQEIPDSRVDNVENLEVAPNNDRNQYLQTGHLSEEGYSASQPASSNDQQQGDDNLPPPGLSRYVPGQQQSESHLQLTGHSFPEPPPGLDRMIPGTDLENATDLNMERQVDGEVSDSASNTNTRPRISGPSTQGDHHHHHHHREEEISDRNLYLVPGESDTHHNQQRVIPGVEDDRPTQGYVAPQQQQQPQPAIDIPINEQQRELVMDGENPHDPPPHVEISREEPIEGGNTLDEPMATASAGTTVGAAGATETDSALTVEPPRKDPSNTSTADESDKDRSMFYSKGKPSRRDEDPLRRSTKSKSSRDRYDTEDSDYSDRERRRREREGSGGVDGQQRDRRRGEREKEKDRRKDGGRDRDRDRGDRGGYDYRDRDRGNRYERDRDRYGGRGGKYDRDSRYETDGSKYDAERSTRYDKDGDGGKRYMSREEYYRKREERGGPPPEDDRRYRKEKDRERGDRYRDERRKDDRYREAGADKRRDRHDRRYDYDDYRTGSRNGTERDRDRDRVRDSRERDDRKDPRDRKYPSSSSAYGAAQYGAASGYYDPYSSYYAQHQQYYEQLRRTNPQAYAEWYRNYCSHLQAAQIQRDVISDGRESVHSGRSSANDKERFNRTTPFLHQPGMYNPDDYHRHFNNQSQPSAMLDQSFLSEVSGQPTSLPMYHHHQQQQQQQQAMAAATFQQQQHQQRATPLIMDRSYHTDSGYYQPRLDNTDGSLRQDPSTMEVLEPERLTPRKFPEIHPIVSVSCGLLVTAKNRLTVNGTTDLVKILSLGINDPTRKLFQSYPGPLVKDKTHKKSVIEFCEEQLRNGPPCGSGHTLIKSRGNSINSLHSFGSNVNRGSFTLLWNYIILLLRQNGTFVGTDISELLMQNKVEFPFESVQASVRSTNVSGRNSSLSATVERNKSRDAEVEYQHLDDEAEDGPENVENTYREDLLESLAEKKDALSETEITDKFRNYLIYGNISDALEWATENSLWGHALFLASKVDSRQHANVMMKFANKLTLNDPLQTLYQLLSGRTPSAVTSVLDEKWGDWRPHLAMLMSNSSAKPELIKKSITTLGDSLYNRGDLYAAHFCYLLSDVSFGRFADVKLDTAGSTITANTTVRLILLGSSHLQRNFREFSTNESIMMTEIYEYARSLNEDRYTIAELQHYKYLLACRMLDYGMQLKCLLYMEQLAEQIQGNPYGFEAEFIKKVYTLGDRLKYYDPVLEKALDESVDNHGHGNIYTNVEDPAWLQRLSAILSNYNVANASNYVQQSSSYDGAVQDYSSYNSYTGYSTEQQPLIQQAPQEQQSYGSDPSDINKEFSKTIDQLGQLNRQYSDANDPQQPQEQQTPTHQYDHSMAAPSYDQGYDSINHSSLADEQQQQQQQQPPPHQPYGYGYEGSAGQPNMFVPAPVASQDQPQQPSPYDYWNTNAEPGLNHPLVSAAVAASSASSVLARSPQVQGTVAAPDSSETKSPSPAPPPPPSVGPTAGGVNYIPKPSITMPNAVSGRPGYDDEDNSGGSPRKGGPALAQAAPPSQQPKVAAADQGKKSQPGKDAKAGGNNSQSNSGWFGGIWNKFSLKPKNQMILPDDKNPTIVWDPENKRWINTDGDEGGEEAFKPPPKMADMMPGAAPPVQQIPSPPGPPAPGPAGPVQNSVQNPGGYGMPAPSMNVDPTTVPGAVSAAGSQPAAPTVPKAVEPTKVPTLQSNMFKMQRNRTLKKSYVDVFNPSGAAPSRPTESILAPAVPTMAAPQGGFFVPGPAPAGGQGNDAATEGMPQFYNPNQFAGGYQQQ